MMKKLLWIGFFVGLLILGLGCRSVAIPDVPMILIPSGSFEMGSELGEADEWPVRTVMLDDFYIDQFEVSNAQYAACVKARVCNLPAQLNSENRQRYYDDPEFADYPVIFVTWSDAATFCRWREARLPTEAEWEMAARGTENFLYPWGNEFDPLRVNACDRNCLLPWADGSVDDGYDDTAPVGSFVEGVSPYGVHDMAGNVWEWVADWYGSDYYAQGVDTNPTGPATGTQHVTRGGGYVNDFFGLRATERRRFTPDVPSSSTGFRCARSP